MRNLIAENVNETAAHSSSSSSSNSTTAVVICWLMHENSGEGISVHTVKLPDDLLVYKITAYVP